MLKTTEKHEQLLDAFIHQVEPKIGLGVQKSTEAKDKVFNKEQELFYRAINYRGS